MVGSAARRRRPAAWQLFGAERASSAPHAVPAQATAGLSNKCSLSRLCKVLKRATTPLYSAPPMSGKQAAAQAARLARQTQQLIAQPAGRCAATENEARLARLDLLAGLLLAALLVAEAARRREFSNRTCYVLQG